MRKKELESSLLLLLAAAIWGFSFVALRVGSKYVGSFTFNGVRFALGSFSLVPLLLYNRNKSKKALKGEKKSKMTSTLISGIIAGTVLFAASSLQMIGIFYTTAGKAGFITGLYIVLVPIFGIFLRQHIKFSTWMGVTLAIMGLYFLSVTESFSISKGDLFEIAGAIFWAVHILLIDYFIREVEALKLSFVQFATCSVLSLIAAITFETITLSGIYQAMVPILYGGICSVGIAFTLQTIGQKYAKPSHAAIVLSMESVFASVGGLIILNEDLGLRGYFGCALMLAGMLLTQLQNFKKS